MASQAGGGFRTQPPEAAGCSMQSLFLVSVLVRPVSGMLVCFSRGRQRVRRGWESSCRTNRPEEPAAGGSGVSS